MWIRRKHETETKVLTVHQYQMPFFEGYWKDFAATHKIAELLTELITSTAPIYKKGLSGHPQKD